MAEQPVIGDWRALLDYLDVTMACSAVERFRVLHLNSRNRLIRDEVMSEGTIGQAAVYVREVVRRALELGSTNLILVHNHPGGDPSPSRADIETTRAIAAAGRPFDICVYDHLVVATGGHVSLAQHGLL